MNVEVVPSRVEATVKITSPSKTVPIKIIPTGSVAFGKAISSINQSVSEVTVYGTSDVLSTLQYIPVEISVEGIKEKTEYKVELEKPAGIRSMSASTVTATIYLDAIAEKDIEGVNINTKNLSENFSGAQGVETSKVTVSVKGVASVIEQITAKDIYAYVDCEGLGEGVHTGLTVNVEGSDVRVEYIAKTKTIDIEIFK